MASSRDVRASDAERTVVIDRLDRALTQGRLSPDEYSDRVRCGPTPRSPAAS